MGSFNQFLLKYLISVNLEKYLSNRLTTKFKSCRVTPTIMPKKEGWDKFFADIPKEHRDSYAQFVEETIRVDVFSCTGQGGNKVSSFYLFFRNKKETRTDLNSHSYSFTQPSSFEIGIMNGGKFVSLLKKHYSDYGCNIVTDQVSDPLQKAVDQMQTDIFGEILKAL